MITRAIVLLGFAAALAVGGEAMAQTKRQPYDVPNLLPRGNPNEMRRDEPWRLKNEDPYAIKQAAPYPYTTPQSRQRAEKAVRDYNDRYQDYMPPPAPAAITPHATIAPRAPRPSHGGYCADIFKGCD